MVVKIFYSKEEIEKLTKVLSLNRNNSKKIDILVFQITYYKRFWLFVC